MCDSASVAVGIAYVYVVPTQNFIPVGIGPKVG